MANNYGLFAHGFDQMQNGEGLFANGLLGAGATVSAGGSRSRWGRRRASAVISIMLLLLVA